MSAEIQAAIAAECDAIKAMLLAKNAAYGNSFAEPIGIFAQGLSPEEQVRVRIDDKLSRIAKGDPSFGDEDTVLDLIGYFVLLRVLQKRTPIDDVVALGLRSPRPGSPCAGNALPGHVYFNGACVSCGVKS